MKFSEVCVAQSTDGAGLCCRSAVCTEHRGARDPDDPQDLSLRWSRFHEHHSGSPENQGDHQCVQEHQVTTETRIHVMWKPGGIMRFPRLIIVNMIFLKYFYNYIKNL